MDYLAIARLVLQELPSSDIQPIVRSVKSDDDRIAQIALTRIKLQMSAAKSMRNNQLTLV